MNELFSQIEPASDAQPDTNGYHTTAQARDWLERNGWKYRHGGGYEKPGVGFATMRAGKSPISDSNLTFIIIERHPTDA